MNLLLLTYAYIPSTGGVQRSVHNLATELAARGHSVLVASDGPCLFDYQPNGPVSHLRLRIPTAFRSRKPDYLQRGLRDTWNLAALAALCARRRIELIHCHLINMDTRYALHLRRWLGIRVVVTLRGGEFGHWVERHPPRRAYVRRILESADAVTALSEAQLADARQASVTLPPLTAVIPNPVDPEKLAALAGPPAASPHPYIVCAGRLEAEKSVGLLLQAYQHLLSSQPDYPFDLLIIGGGSLQRPLQESAAAGPAASRIRFTGEIDYPSSLALIRDAALLVLPTERGEGCPNVVLEAMALGTPVLASANPPLLELIEDRINGETFPSGSVTALCERLAALGRDQASQARYVREARQFLHRRHRMFVAMNRYESLYQEVAARRS